MENISIRDFLEYGFPSALSVSKDGKMAVFCVSTADEEKNGYSRCLWKWEEGQGAGKLAETEESAGFCFLDNDRILYSCLKGKDKERAAQGEFLTVFYEMDLRNQTWTERFRVPLKAASACRIREGLFLLSAVRYNDRPDLESLEEGEKQKGLEKWKREQDFIICDELPFLSDGRGYINKQRRSLYLYDEKTGRCTPLTSPYFETSFFAVNSDGSRIAFSGVEYDRYYVRTHGIYLYDVESGESRTLLTPGSYQIMGLDFLGEELAVFAAPWNGEGAYPNHNLYTLPLSGGPMRLRHVHSREDFGSKGCGDCKYGGGKVYQVCGERLYYMTTCETYVYINSWRPGEEPRRLNQKAFIPESLAVAAGRVFAVGSTGGPTEICRLSDDGTEEVLTEINRNYRENHRLQKPKRFTFTDHDGFQVHGFVVEPVDYDPAKTYPGILEIHGGPRAAFTAGFFHEIQALAARGYFVFYCNPRGSAGGGEAFADIRGRRGCNDYQDLMEWTDFVLKQYPAIDPMRLAVMGGSYGGYMTNWIITHTRRFAAAISMRSIVDIAGSYGATDYGIWGTPGVYGGTPWANEQRLREQSPYTYAMNITTPTLFLHSLEDFRCSVSGAFQLYSAMQLKGVPTRMCLFKGECHELSRSGRPRSRMKRLEEITNWLDAYLKP